MMQIVVCYFIYACGLFAIWLFFANYLAFILVIFSLCQCCYGLSLPRDTSIKILRGENKENEDRGIGY